MKLFFVLAILSTALPASASREHVRLCGGVALAGVTREIGALYDRGAIAVQDCRPCTEGAFVCCYLSASKGHGAGTDAYLALLNKSCVKVMDVTYNP